MASSVFRGPSGVYAMETRERWYDSHDLATVRKRAEEMAATPVILLENGTREPAEHAGVWIVPRVNLVRWLTTRSETLEQGGANALAEPA